MIHSPLMEEISLLPPKSSANKTPTKQNSSNSQNQENIEGNYQEKYQEKYKQNTENQEDEEDEDEQIQSTNESDDDIMGRIARRIIIGSSLGSVSFIGFFI